jgi:predicted secreted Zn-dependent protease
MIKSTVFLILLLITAASICAAQDKIVTAKADKNIDHLAIKPSILPKVTETYKYYEVQGASEPELSCDMNRNSCRWDDGKKYDSVTSWRVKWNYNYDRTPQSCTAVSFEASVDIVFRYPKWVHAGGVPDQLIAKWNNYMKNLTVHENGHRDMAVKAAAELTQSVSKLPPAKSCTDLDREVQTLCRLRMKKLNDDENAYDVRTQHGFTQGAIFP